jgi:hypothetical protein
MAEDMLPVGGAGPQQEEIPDADSVHRLIDFPFMYQELQGLIWGNVFQFPAGLGESVVWSKYAQTHHDVHAIGCERQRNKRHQKPEFAYKGCVSALVADIRGKKTRVGHGFDVIHVPSQGIHHAEIRYQPAPQVTLTKPEKAELKLALNTIFGALNAHQCT